MLLIFALACLASAAAAAAAAPTAQTTSGPILGLATDFGGSAFLGVPFAKALRFGPPRAPTPWAQPLNATAYNAGCINFHASAAGADATEDCLTANIWLPASPTPGAPLLIWIHGGGFVFGNGAGDFSRLANGTGAVIVSLNYRLGSLGFLSLEGFAPAFPTPTDPDAACANVGLLDQQAGMQWASANARAFGADPAHALVVGQSAGGSSVLFALTLPGAYTAYRAAWAVSPGSPTNSLAAGRATAAAIAARLGCPAAAGAAAQLACLRAVPAAAVVSAALAVAGTGSLPLTLGPVIDGALVTASPAAAILAGAFNRNATVLVSGTLFEGDSLLDGFTHSTSLTAAQAAAALAQFGLQVGFAPATTAAVGAAYAPLAQRDGNFNGASRIWGDGLISCAVAWAARGAAGARGAGPVHRLLYNTTFPGEPAGRATHGSDLQVLFNGAGAPGLAASVWAWAANAAVTGDVNSGPLTAAVAWPAYDGGRSLLAANEKAEFALLDAWQEEYCDSLWLPILP